jgi:hypothetical protein
MLARGGIRHRTEVTMGDKSPKSKQRNQKQKDAEKNQTAAKAKAKQVGAAQQAPAKGKK